MTIGEQIKNLRKEKKWTQAELAKKVGTKQSSISRAESEDYGKLSLTALQKIADELGYKVLVNLVR